MTQFIAFYRTNDMEATHRFYAGALGLELVLDQGACRIFRVNDDAYVGFCGDGEVPQPASSVVITLVADDVSAWYERCLLAGLVVDGPPRTNAKFGIFHFYVDAPDGYRLEVQRFLDADWATPTEKADA